MQGDTEYQTALLEMWQGRPPQMELPQPEVKLLVNFNDSKKRAEAATVVPPTDCKRASTRKRKDRMKVSRQRKLVTQDKEGWSNTRRTSLLRR